MPVYLGGCCDVMGGGGINWDFTTGVFTTSDMNAANTTITTDMPSPFEMIVYPAPQGIAPTEYGRNGAIFMCVIRRRMIPP